MPANIDVVALGRQFDDDLSKLCREMKGRKFNARVEREFRARVLALVDDLYRRGGFLMDYRDETPIFDPQQVHLSVSYERNDLQFSIVRKQGRLQ